MANELHNAISLMRDSNLRDLLTAAAVYQSRLVVMEAATVASHATRLNMANACLVNPTVMADRLTNIIACDPAVAALGTTADAIPEDVILNKVASVWTPLANLYYAA